MSTFEQKKTTRGNAAPKIENLDAERIVCATFMAHNGLFEVYSDRLKAENFHDPMHRQIMEVGARLVVENKPANGATIASKITELSPIPDLTVPAYLRELNRFIKSKDEVEAYVSEVTLAAKRRAVLALAEQFAAKAHTADHDIISQLSSAVALLSGGSENAGFRHMEPAFDRVFQEIMVNDKAGFGPTGYRSGFKEIDNAVGGFKRAKLYYLVAQEKAGKSALGLSLIRQFLLQDIPCGIISLEMKEDEVGQRFIAMESGINTVNRPQGMRLDEEEAVRLSEAADRCGSWPVYCNDLSTLTPSAIIMNCRHAVKVHGVKVILVDYIQIVSAEDERQDNRTRVEKASRAMARMAKELNIPVIALAQFNRETLKRASVAKWQDYETAFNAARPRRGDTRETAQLEMDADAIIGIFRPEVLLKELRPFEAADNSDEMVEFDFALSKLKGKAELSVILNRSGIDGVRCSCRFKADIGLFEPEHRRI